MRLEAPISSTLLRVYTKWHDHCLILKWHFSVHHGLISVDNMGEASQSEWWLEDMYGGRRRNAMNTVCDTKWRNPTLVPLPSSRSELTVRWAVQICALQALAGTAGIKGGRLTQTAAASWNTIPFTNKKLVSEKSKLVSKSKFSVGPCTIKMKVAMKMKSLL